MLGYVIRYGTAAGVVVGGLMLLTVGLLPMQHGALGMAIGYATMLIALSAVFVGIKRYRDAAGGGVIGFWRAFGLGLAISAVAGMFYVAAWEVTQALFLSDFMENYTASTLAKAQADGASAAELARMRAEMAALAAQYRNPLFRLPITFAEIFPVGVLVSMISAAMLRNPRVLPATRTVA